MDVTSHNRRDGVAMCGVCNGEMLVKRDSNNSCFAGGGGVSAAVILHKEEDLTIASHG